MSTTHTATAACAAEQMPRLIERHFAGRITPQDERYLRLHLDGCATCRDTYRRHQLLSLLDPRALAAKERLRRGLGLAGPRRSWLHAFSLLAVPCAAMVLAVVGLTLLLPLGPTFQSRGGGVPPAENGIWIFQIDGRGAARRVTGTIQAGDELAFAYQNPRGKRYLLVFGVDERREIYWYHPAWRSSREDPRAVPISTAGGTHELPEAIRQPLRGGKLALYAVFTDEVFSVHTIEELIAGGLPHAAPLPLRGARQVITVLEVERPLQDSPGGRP